MAGEFEDGDIEDPNRPVITTPTELAEALAAAFVGNADRGHDAANDELVRQIVAAKREQGPGPPG